MNKHQMIEGLGYSFVLAALILVVLTAFGALLGVFVTMDCILLLTYAGLMMLAGTRFLESEKTRRLAQKRNQQIKSEYKEMIRKEWEPYFNGVL